MTFVVVLRLTFVTPEREMLVALFGWLMTVVTPLRFTVVGPLVTVPRLFGVTLSK